MRVSVLCLQIFNSICFFSHKEKLNVEDHDPQKCTFQIASYTYCCSAYYHLWSHPSHLQGPTVHGALTRWDIVVHGNSAEHEALHPGRRDTPSKTYIKPRQRIPLGPVNCALLILFFFYYHISFRVALIHNNWSLLKSSHRQAGIISLWEFMKSVFL